MVLRIFYELNAGLITPPTENTCKTVGNHKLHFMIVFGVCYTKQMIKENDSLILFIVDYEMLSLLWKQERTKYKKALHKWW